MGVEAIYSNGSRKVRMWHHRANVGTSASHKAEQTEATQVTIAAGLKTVESQFIIENNTNCLCLLQVPPRENNKMSGNIPFIPLVDVWSIHEIYLAEEGAHDSTRPTGWEHVYFIGTGTVAGQDMHEIEYRALARWILGPDYLETFPGLSRDFLKTISLAEALELANDYANIIRQATQLGVLEFNVEPPPRRGLRRRPASSRYRCCPGCENTPVRRRRTRS